MSGGKTEVFIYGLLLEHLLFIENRTDGGFSGKASRWTPRCFMNKEEREIASEPPIDICAGR